MQYNSAFFNLYENWYFVIQNELGKAEALRLFRKVMEKGLAFAYGENFTFGDTEEFARLVGERDEKVGLVVSFPEVKKDKIIYRFHTDPFPNLKGIVDHHELDDTYIKFKVQYILGDEWKYKNISHLWDGKPFTEFVIFK